MLDVEAAACASWFIDSLDVAREEDIFAVEVDDLEDDFLEELDFFVVSMYVYVLPDSFPQFDTEEKCVEDEEGDGHVYVEEEAPVPKLYDEDEEATGQVKEEEALDRAAADEEEAGVVEEDESVCAEDEDVTAGLEDEDDTIAGPEEEEEATGAAEDDDEGVTVAEEDD